MSKAKATAGAKPKGRAAATSKAAKPSKTAAAPRVPKAPAAPKSTAASRVPPKVAPSRPRRRRAAPEPAAADVATAPAADATIHIQAPAATASAAAAAATSSTAPRTAGSVVADTFRSADGTSTYYCVWRPEGPPKRQVILIHGFADHLGRYSYLVGSLVKNGAVVYAYDQRGNGRSEGKRGHITSYHQLLDELDTFVRLASQAEPDLPRVMYAHSTGAILGLTYLYDHPDAVDAAVLSAPCLMLTFDAPGWKTSIGRTLSRIAPGFTMQAGFDPGVVSRDEKVVEANKSDPLVSQAMSARFYTEVYLTALPAALARIEDLKVPYLLLQGTADKLVSPRVADEFETRATVPGVIRRYEGGYHESHNDIHRQEVFADVAAWLDTAATARVKPAAAKPAAAKPAARKPPPPKATAPPQPATKAAAKKPAAPRKAATKAASAPPRPSSKPAVKATAAGRARAK